MSDWRTKPKGKKDQQGYDAALKAAETCRALLPDAGWHIKVWHNHGSWHFAITNGGIDVRPYHWENGPPYSAGPTTCEAFWTLGSDKCHSKNPNVAIRKAVDYMDKVMAAYMKTLNKAHEACIGFAGRPKCGCPTKPSPYDSPR